LARITLVFMSHPGAGELPFVERGEELAALLDSVRGAGAAIVGPAGIGKSRLLAEAAKQLDGDRFRVVHAYGSQSASAIPLGAFAPLVPLDPRPPAGALMRTVIDQLIAQAGDRRLVLAIDDAQLLDDASAAVVEQLVRHRRGAVLLTARQFAGSGPVAGILHADLLSRMELGPLRRERIRPALNGLLGGPPDAGTADRLWQATDGNFLLLVEMLRNALGTGDLAEKDGVWTLHGRPAAGPRLSELMGQRIGRLTGPERAALELLAFGEPLGAALLQRVVPVRVLEELEERGLIRVRQEDRRTTIRLAHPLYSDALRARCPRSRANQRMRELAAAFTEAGARRGDDSMRIASWLLAAGEPAPADLLTHAARQAYAAFDLPLAQQLSREALSGGATAAGSTLVESLLLDLRPAEAEELLTDLWPGLDPAGRWALAYPRIQNLAIGLGRADQAEQLLAELERQATEQGSAERITVLRTVIDFVAARLPAVIERSQAAIAGGLEQQPLRTQLDLSYGSALAVSGRPLTSLEVLDRCARDSQQPWVLPAYELARAWARHFLGDTTPTVAAAEQAAQRWPGWDLGQIGYGSAGAQAYRLQGRVKDAWQLLQPAIPVVRRSAASRLDTLCLAEAAHAAALLGDHKSAAELATEARLRALPAWRVHGLWLEIALPWVAAAGGKHEECVRLGLRAVHRARECSATSLELIALHDLVRFGSAELAADRLAELANWAQGPCPALYAAHAKAAIAADPVALGSVSERFAELGMILHAAEAMAQSAVAFRATGDTRSGQAAAGRAGVLADACQGARTPALAAIETPTLTARERQIARLAAAGLTNQQIAEQLSVSRRTVENHLYSGYVKLGTRNREELAALLAD
jgi:DNA-binding CsgD family transcriptional regulator